MQFVEQSVTLCIEQGRLRLSRLCSLIWIVSVLHFGQKVVLFFYLWYQNIVKCLAFLPTMSGARKQQSSSIVCNKPIRSDRAGSGLSAAFYLGDLRLESK